MKGLFSITLSSILAGTLSSCTTGEPDPGLASSHPASVAGAEAPLPNRSATLDVSPNAAADVAASVEEGAAPDAPPAAHAAHQQHVSPSPSPAPQASTAREVYSCPMHPEMTSTTAGSCPKCGMKLVKRRPSGKPAGEMR